MARFPCSRLSTPTPTPLPLYFVITPSAAPGYATADDVNLPAVSVSPYVQNRRVPPWTRQSSSLSIFQNGTRGASRPPSN